MPNFVVIDLTPNTLTHQDGQIIFEKIKEVVLEQNNIINLNFTGCEIVTAPFFETAIGQIFNNNALFKNIKCIRMTCMAAHVKVIKDKVAKESMLARERRLSTSGHSPIDGGMTDN